MEYSETEAHFLVCPHCGHRFLQKLKVNFNTADHPEDKAAVRNGSAFVVRCPRCGHEWHLHYSFFYDQPEDLLAVYCLTEDKDAASVADAIRRNTLPPQAQPSVVPRWQQYTWRVVRTEEECREKLAIFDAGLDDRCIELFKVFILNQLQAQAPDFHADEVWFARNPDKPAGDPAPYVFTIVDLKTNQVAQTPFDDAIRPLYDQIAVNFGDDMERLFSREPVIDLTWARNCLDAIQTKN